MKLSENFNQQDFDIWIEGFLPDFDRNVRKVDVPASFSNVKSINTLGESPIGVRVYVIETDADPSRRKVGLATDSFTLLKNYGSPNAIIAYYSENATLWRISLLTSTPIWSDGKIITKLSNPKRQSYVLGAKAKVKTPHQYLISKGKVLDFNDLKSRFSLEVVNKEFYKEISQAFTQLVGGTVAKGKSKKSHEALLKLPFLKDHSQANLEFAVRLIGRIIFCWFLREKRSASGHSLMPKELVSFEASQTIEDYYHKILEPIFFEILNKPVKTRKDSYINELFSAIPYLNGGLFSPHEDDFFSYNEGKQAVNHNMVVVPDSWLKSLLEVLETYNFTIDENTSFDEELSIDPEMLGRIFENLLAEINPETGESARKSTGSYYTPRLIVDYMVDESLYLYVKQKTNISEEKLRSLISYDLDDDTVSPLSSEEKTKIAESLGEIKILDPACGSGAFPIGALQKIVFILQQIDPLGQLWFKKQIKNTPIELRKVIEREFEQKNFDYIRKLGIIRENIYGIDIQPIATEISRLRCFLTLVVDERIDDTLDNRGIEPLPNLDFKFVTANTLVGLPKISMQAQQYELFEDQDNIEQLKETRDLYFNASGLEREQLKSKFIEIQNNMFRHIISMKQTSELTYKLSDWDPFSHKSSSWFDPEWMFGINGGFDILVSNPPWGATLNKDEKKILKDNFPEIDSSTPNSFAYFLGLGNRISKNILCYILPDSILIKDYKKTRKLLSRNITEISWYQNTGLPEDMRPFVYVEHDVCILISRKSETDLLKFKLNSYSPIKKGIVHVLGVQDKKSVIKKEFDYIYNLIIHEKDLVILKKLMKFEPLSNTLQCHEGIHSGNIREKLFIHEYKDYAKPMFYGGGIGGDIINNYASKRNNWYVNYDSNIINKKHGEYASLRDERIFMYPKIYVTRTGNPFKAFFDEANYASNNFFSLQYKNYDHNTGDELKVILPLITSKVTQYFIRRFAAPRLGNTFVETKIIHLLKMRLPSLNKDSKCRLLSYSNKMIKNVDNEVECFNLVKEIDNYIYKLFGLDDKDINHIESTL